MTNTTKNVETVIKTDDWGRMQTPAKRRERLLDEFERSSLSGAKFAAALPGFFSVCASDFAGISELLGELNSRPFPLPRRPQTGEL